VSYPRLEADGLQWPCPEPGHPGTQRLHESGFAHGRASLSCVEYAPSPEHDVAGFPYLLNTGRVLQQYNVGTMTRRTPNAALAPADELEVHPDDAARERIANGDVVGLESRWGRLRARARVSTRVLPGTLFLSFHYPETHANRVTGPHRDSSSHCPEYKVTSVRFMTE
jgi:predicted molibdopterin-dependent oxidoreductase YjgC